MKTSRYTEAQILAILRQAEGGMPLAELCRAHGMSSASFCKWRATYGGITIQHIEPGRPRQNACIGRYNRTIRHECWINASLSPSRRHRTSPRNGSGHTTTTGRTWVSAASPPP
jgi:putative transposase